VLVVQLLSSLATVVLLRNIATIEDVISIKYKPSVLYVVFAVILAASIYFSKNGLLYIVWGKRLEFSVGFWRLFTLSFACLMLALSLLNVVVANVVSLEIWLFYKSIAPLFTEIVFCFAFPLFLNKTIRSPSTVA
jgi:intracellular septation protein